MYFRLEVAKALLQITPPIPPPTGGGSGTGSGILVYQTLAALQSAMPNGSTVPVWVVAEENWYYWDGPITDTTPPVVTISPAGGTFNSIQSVTLSANETATIYYTTDGSTPTTSSTVYSGPISVNADMTLRCFARDTAGNNSTIQSATYTIDLTVPDTTPPTVNISPNAGTYTSVQNVTLSADETATIYYTVDGSTPTTESAVYSSAIPINVTTTLRYFARDTTGNNSAVQTAAYTINLPAQDTTPPVVTATPGAGTFSSAQNVTLSTDETATIYYTTNGTTPTTASTQYTGPIAISATTTLQFMARDTAGNNSTPVAATYTINASTVTWTYLFSDSTINAEPGTSGSQNWKVSLFIPKQAKQVTVIGVNTASGTMAGKTFNLWKVNETPNPDQMGTLVGTGTFGSSEIADGTGKTYWEGNLAVPVNLVANARYAIEADCSTATIVTTNSDNVSMLRDDSVLQVPGVWISQASAHTGTSPINGTFLMAYDFKMSLLELIPEAFDFLPTATTRLNSGTAGWKGCTFFVEETKTISKVEIGGNGAPTKVELWTTDNTTLTAKVGEITTIDTKVGNYYPATFGTPITLNAGQWYYLAANNGATGAAYAAVANGRDAGPFTTVGSKIDTVQPAAGRPVATNYIYDYRVTLV